MGRGKGKKGRKEPRSPAKKLPITPKKPKVSNPLKQDKNFEPREGTAAAKIAMPTPTGTPRGLEDPTARPGTFIQGPPQANWSAMWKKDLRLLERRIKSLDRQMLPMRAYMLLLPEGSMHRLDYELGERSNWRHICGMMDRARELLCMVKEEAKGILPQKILDDNKGTGIVGMHFERLVPQLNAKAAELGYDPSGRGGPSNNTDGAHEDGDSEMTDSSSDSDFDSNSSLKADEGDKITGSVDFISLNISSKILQFGAPHPTTVGKGNTTTVNGVDPSPNLFVDTRKVTTKQQIERKSKPAEAKAEKQANREQAKEMRGAAATAGENKSRKRRADSRPVESEPGSVIESPATPPADIDFVALQASLKAEVDAATKAQAEAEAKAAAEKKAKRKRRRSSGVDAELKVVEKKVKKDMKVMVEKVKEKKRKADYDSAGSEETGQSAKKKVRKHKLHS